MKKAVQILVLVFFLTGLLFSVALAKPLRIGIVGRGVPLRVAHDRGLFKKYGLDTEIIDFQATTIMLPSLIAGEIQLADSGASTIVNARAGGAEVVIIAVFIDTLPFTLVASEKIKSASQLKGKRLGVGRLGDVADVSLRMVLKNLGIDAGKDVAIVSLAGGTAARFAALKAAGVDATVITPPLTVMARKLGFNEIVRFQDAGIKWAFDTVAATTGYAKSNRETMLNFLKGLIEGIAYIHKNREGTLALLSKQTRLSDREALEETYDDLLKTVQRKPFSSEEGIQVNIDETSKTNPKAQQLKPQDIVDMQYLRELEQNGFFEQMYR